MKTIGVGIIGYEVGRSWAAVAHVPALRALPDYEVVAVATTRRETAEAAARDIGLSMDAAFDDAVALTRDPRVDVVAVTVKVPHHRVLVSAALAAGKHVYCEWPLGNGLTEAEAMAAEAAAAGVHAAIGLQARLAPPVRQAKALIADGYVGEVLSTTLIGSGMQWGDTIDRPNAYIIDASHGATMLAIPFGHTIDALRHVLGDFASLSATMAIRQPEVTRVETGETLVKTADDQIAVSGVLQRGAIAAIHYRGGMPRGTGLLWEIQGTKGDLRLTAAGGHAQILDLTLTGARGGDRDLKPIAIDAASRWVPADLAGPAVNVAQVYARLARDIRDGTHETPGFAEAVETHRLLDAIERAARTGARIAA
ncbi:Gfo/Idh/MocA family protein [Sphingomonas profundi]|uniref:Gfo/Idh/MocA family protein n=1 Tax=Alterirhizorhabdus profundi TaxID=2681549 RepID=UPI0018D11647|nr:Gfo/Idh/MocA family oxidoreductase [Sphingomonas profundi]